MNSFNFNRFSQALKCQFLVSRKSWIRLFGIYTLVLFVANLFWTRVQGFSYSIMETWPKEDLLRAYNQHVVQSVSFGIFFFCIAMLFGATSMFSQMKDTRKRSAYLLWPVSNMEKYIVSFLHAFVLMAILTVAAYMLADSLRVFVDLLTGRVIIWGIPKLFEPFGTNAVVEYWQTTWMGLAWVFYIHSLYIVGGTLFRRQQFLFTSGTIAVVVILLTMILNQIDWNSVDFKFITGTWDEKTNTYTQTFHASFYIINSVVTLLIPIHYWISYKLFTRMQVINNKWLNV